MYPVSYLSGKSKFLLILISLCKKAKNEIPSEQKSRRMCLLGRQLCPNLSFYSLAAHGSACYCPIGYVVWDGGGGCSELKIGETAFLNVSAGDSVYVT